MTLVYFIQIAFFVIYCGSDRNLQIYPIPIIRENRGVFNLNIFKPYEI